MAAVAKGVALSLGLVTASVSIYSAIEPTKTGNKNCCVGTAGAEHDPTPISQVNRCATCDRDVPYGDIVKAHPVGDGFVVLEDTDIESAKADATAMKKVAAMAPKLAAEVEVTMASGEKLYHLVPELGHETTYAILRHLVREHPELAFMVQWTPRSNAGTFRVLHRDGVLMLSERVIPGRIKATPEVKAEAPEAMLAMGEQILALPGVVTDFDPETYTDKYAENLAAIIATKQIVAAGGTATVSAPSMPAGQQNAMAALEAMLAAAAPAPAPAKAKRTAKVKAS
jgi:non-homologous end joining protein Ku